MRKASLKKTWLAAKQTKAFQRHGYFKDLYCKGLIGTTVQVFESKVYVHKQHAIAMEDPLDVMTPILLMGIKPISTDIKRKLSIAGPHREVH